MGIKFIFPFHFIIDEEKTLGLLFEESKQSFPRYIARDLAQVVGKNSMTWEMGNLTRCSSIEITTKESWDSKLLFKNIDQVLYTWIKCFPCKNTRFLHSARRKNVIIYSDVIYSAISAYTVKVNFKVFHLLWKADGKI